MRRNNETKVPSSVAPFNRVSVGIIALIFCIGGIAHAQPEAVVPPPDFPISANNSLGAGSDAASNQGSATDLAPGEIEIAPEPLAVTMVEAERGNPFSALVGRRSDRKQRRPAAFMVERYVIATDGRSFLFETQGEQARIKFLCGDEDARLDCTIDPERPAEEIHLLTPTTGPRGDLIFKDRHGDTFLRLASYGGATVFWPGEEAGHAASKSFGDETSLRLPFASVDTVRIRAQLATAQMSALTQAPIIFDIGKPGLDDEVGAAVLADAIIRAASGLQRVANDPTGAAVIAQRIRTVKLIADDIAEISLDGTSLEVRYRPAGDLAGRPSSAAVAHFLENTL